MGYKLVCGYCHEEFEDRYVKLITHFFLYHGDEKMVRDLGRKILVVGFG